MKIGIVGWGLEGQSAFNYFGAEHDYLIVNEHPREDFPPESDKIKVRFITDEKPVGVTGNVTDLSYLDGIDSCDMVVCTPTSYKNLESRFGDNEAFFKKVTTSMAVFFEDTATKNIIGVTGTKGKGTTSTLIFKMLEAAGKKVFLGGNIGTPVLDFIDQVGPDDWVVLEMSSFQLYSLKTSPHVSVCLMIAPEHLDWHADINEYVEAKANIFRYQKAEDYAVYLSGNSLSERAAGYSGGTKIPYFTSPGARVDGNGMIIVGEEATEICPTSQMKLLGRHNWQNACAAVTAVWQVTQDINAIKSALQDFGGLEHRLEFVRELDNVSYYDDSFGTTPDTAIVALQAFVKPEVLIVGGSDKGVPFDDLVDEIARKDRVRHVIAIGQTGPLIAQKLREKGFSDITEGLTAMPEIVAEAKQRAQAGDVVLLSTGCASFGLFKDYKDRGNQFKQAVQALA